MPTPPAGRAPSPFRSPAWVLLSGLLLGLSFPPMGLYPLAWFALVPLVVRWARARSVRSILGDAYAAFLTMSVLAGYWTLLHEQIAKATLAAALLLTLPLLLSLPFAAAWHVRRRMGLFVGFVVLATVSILQEYALAEYFVPLPWMQLGYTQVSAPLLTQATDLSGVATLSLWLWLLGGLGAWAVLTPRFFRPVFAGRLVALLVFGVAFAAPFYYGSERLAELQRPPSEADASQAGTPEAGPPEADVVRVGLVQPAMPPEQWLYSDPAERVNHLAALSERLLAEAGAASGERPDFVVWPELALPAYADMTRTRGLYGRVMAWTQSRNVTLLTGAATRPDVLTVGSLAPAGVRYNSALLFSPDRSLQRSDQVQLHPAFSGASYVEPPTVVASSPAAWELARAEQAFQRGASKQLLATQRGALVPLIGFESLFTEQTRAHVARGGDLLVILTQNDWWGFMPSPELHFALSRLLAIETRRPVVMSTVNGVSGVVLADGTPATQARAGERTTTSFAVPLSQTDSPYLRRGNVVVRGSAVLLLTTLMLGLLFSFAFGGTPAKRAKANATATPIDTHAEHRGQVPGLSWPEQASAYEDTPSGYGGGYGYAEERAAAPAFPDDGDLWDDVPPAAEPAPAASLETASFETASFETASFEAASFESVAFDDQPSAPPADAGNLEETDGVPASPPAPPEPSPWSDSPSPSSSPPPPPDADASSASWVSPSRFTSPVTPKRSPPAERPETP